MNQSKMGLVQDMIQVMVVIIDLRRGELPLIHYILRRQTAYVEPFGKRTLVK